MSMSNQRWQRNETRERWLIEENSDGDGNGDMIMMTVRSENDGRRWQKNEDEHFVVSPRGVNALGSSWK